MRKEPTSNDMKIVRILVSQHKVITLEEIVNRIIAFPYKFSDYEYNDDIKNKIKVSPCRRSRNLL